MYPPSHVIQWIESAPDVIKQKLQALGLIELPNMITLDELISEIIRIKKSEIKKVTRYNYYQNANRFMSFFGKDIKKVKKNLPEFEKWLANRYDPKVVKKTLRVVTKYLEYNHDITSHHVIMRYWAFIGRNTYIHDVTNDIMHGVKSYLLDNYTSSTAHTTMSFVKQLFNRAVEKKYIAQSPASNIIIPIKISRDKDRTITISEYTRLLDACPDQQWRVIIALARIGGLRCPSELKNLRWSDINFEQAVITIRSTKTEHHEGGATRVMPIFGDLRVEIDKLYFDSGNDSTDYVITAIHHAADKKVSLTAKTNAIIRKAGLGDIPRFYDNCRTSRSNELVRKYGSDLENAWLGHSDKVRKKYYWLQNDKEIATATSEIMIEEEQNYICKNRCDTLRNIKKTSEKPIEHH
jgi:integrase